MKVKWCGQWCATWSLAESLSSLFNPCLLLQIPHTKLLEKLMLHYSLSEREVTIVQTASLHHLSAAIGSSSIGCWSIISAEWPTVSGQTEILSATADYLEESDEVSKVWIVLSQFIGSTKVPLAWPQIRNEPCSLLPNTPHPDRLGFNNHVKLKIKPACNL